MHQYHDSSTAGAAQPTSNNAQDAPATEERLSPVRLGDKLLYDITRQLMDAAKGMTAQIITFYQPRIRPGAAKPSQLFDHLTYTRQDIPVGDLVKHETFELHEAVGAIEVMDPRMDTGYLQEQEGSLDDDFDFNAVLTPEQILGIMDELLCLEVAWHQGHPLLQTIFTSVHIDKLLSSDATLLEEVHFSDQQAGMMMTQRQDGQAINPISLVTFILRAYCIGLIVCCDNVIIRVTSGNPIYYEDEDISTNTFNRDMLGRFDRPVDQAIDLLHVAIDWLDEIKLFEPGLIPMEESVLQGIVDRLTFRMLFLQLTFFDVNEPQNYAEEATTLLDSIKTTHTSAQSVRTAFSDKIQRRLASTQPPRPSVKPDFSEAVEEMAKLCRDCDEATQLLTLRSGEELVFESPWEVEAFLWAFMSRKPEPHPFTRSYLQNLLIKGIGQDDMPHWQAFFSRDIAETVLPGVISSREARPLQDQNARSFLISRVVVEFGQNVIPVQYGYADYFRILCQNRCRVRRLLLHHIRFLDSLGYALSDAETGAQGFMPSISDKSPLALWVSHRKLRSLERVLKLGFEQDIYEADELEVLYMVLAQLTTERHTLSIGLVANLENVSKETERVERQVSMEPILLSHRRMQFLNQEALRESVLAQTTVHLLMAFRLLGFVNVPAIGDMRLRAELRFKHLRGVDQSVLEPFKKMYASEMSNSGQDTSSSQVISDVFARAMEFHKEINTIVSKERKMGNAGSLRSEVLVSWWGQHLEDLVALVANIGIALLKLQKLWRDGISHNHHMVVPRPEERILSSWAVPKSELGPIKGQAK